MSARKITVGVVLSGCGHQDGAEIHEATLTLWAIHRHGAEFQCYAPDVDQRHVLNHLSGREMNERRNVLVESARIARGKILPLADFDVEAMDAVVFPGGLGAAKNLSNYAFAGADCVVNEEAARVIRAMHERGKPIGALCIAPVLLARVLGAGVSLTIGQDSGSAANLEKMGGRHQATMQGEIVVDHANKVVTTPCYMLNSRVDQIGEGADRLIVALLEMAGQVRR